MRYIQTHKTTVTENEIYTNHKTTVAKYEIYAKHKTTVTEYEIYTNHRTTVTEYEIYTNLKTSVTVSVWDLSYSVKFLYPAVVIMKENLQREF